MLTSVMSGEMNCSMSLLRLHVSLSVAALPHADDRGRVAAALAPERQVAEEAVTVDPRPAQQRGPGDVGDPPAARAHGPQVRIALGLGLGDRSGSPVVIDFHRGGHCSGGAIGTL